MESAYEKFRSILIMNLSATLPGDQLDAVMAAVDLSMHGFDVKEQETSIIPASGVPEVVKYYIAARSISSLSMGTLEQYRYKLVNFFRKVNKPFTDITSNDIRFYLHIFKQERNASDRYMEGIRVTLNTFFQWLVDKEYLTKNPCTNVDKIKYQPKRRKSLSSYELEYFRWNTKDIREKALIDFFYSTGMRVSECAAVQLTDIDWGNRSVLIRHGKGDKERLVYFNAESEVSLREYLDSRTDDCTGLFVSMRKPIHQIDTPALEKIIRNVSRRTGVEAYPHKLRHTFATTGIHSGMPLETLQQLMGHAKPETTLIYVDQDRTDIQNAYSKAYA